jgi:hypothetical protein
MSRNDNNGSTLGFENALWAGKQFIEITTEHIEQREGTDEY